jgi:hypothetical protein
MQLSFDTEQDIDLRLDNRAMKSTSPPDFGHSTIEKRFSIAKPRVRSVTPEQLSDDPGATALYGPQLKSKHRS